MKNHESVDSRPGGNKYGSWIGLFIRNPLPLYQVLYNTEVVKQVAGIGNEIQIMIPADE